MDYFAHRIHRADLVNGVIMLHFSVVKPDKDGNYNPDGGDETSFTVNMPLQGFMRSMGTMRELIKDLQERGILKNNEGGEAKEGEGGDAVAGGQTAISGPPRQGGGGRGPGGPGGGRGPGGPGGPGGRGGPGGPGGGRGQGGPGGGRGPGGPGGGRGPGGPGQRQGGPERPRMRDITNEDDSSEPLV